MSAQRSYLVYWLYDEHDELMYIGTTRMTLNARLCTHKHTRSFPPPATVVVEQVPSLEDAIAYETNLIYQLRPRYNRRVDPPVQRTIEVMKKDGPFPLDDWFLHMRYPPD